jgi:LmbE family N-acetylglucosaminyl deacetylase
MAKKSKGNILVLCAHSDDQVIGAGGAMSEYAKQGYNVHTMIFSYGENVKPHMKPEVITKMRVEESEKADRILGGSGVVFLGLKELAFEAEIQKHGKEKELDDFIKKYKPVKIFTHATDDAHPDHRSTLRIVLKAYKRLKLDCELYTFEVWHLFNLRKRRKPKLIIDITPSFKKKIDALLAFKSQINLSNFYNYIVLNNFFYFSIHIKDFINGLNNGCKYAEIFYKLR